MGTIFGHVEGLGYSFLLDENNDNKDDDNNSDNNNQKKSQGSDDIESGGKNAEEPKGKGKAEAGEEEGGKKKEENPLVVADQYLLAEVQKLDLNGVDEAYSILLNHSQLTSALMNAFSTIANTIRYSSRSFSTGVELRCLLILLRNPLLNDNEYHGDVLGPLLVGVSHLSKRLRTTLIAYFATDSVSGEALGELVGMAQQFITLRQITHEHIPLHDDELIVCAVRTLALFYRANLCVKKIDEVMFYNDLVSDRLAQKEELEREYETWQNNAESNSFSFCFCDYPFVLTATAKSKVIRRESKDQQRMARIDHIRSFLERGMLPFMMGGDRLIWKIRRENLLEDTLMELNRHDSKDLKKELKVIFVGEEAVDEGGVQKELFMLICRQLFNPQYGMFFLSNTTRTFWFNPSCIDWVELELIGKILGLAIYNGIILDLQFPSVVYKKLLGLKPDFKDLCDGFPSFGDGLKQLLKYEGDVENDLGLTFQVMIDNFGHTTYVDLKEGGSEIAVTNENRQEFVDLYVNHYLNVSIAKQFDYFSRGFRMVCDGPALRLFNVSELEVLICGSPKFDFHDLEESCLYQGFEPDSEPISWFWEVVNSFTLEEKKKLLVFSTGSDRSPVGGLQNLNFVIVKHGDEDDRLPQSHTCFNVLLLPDYSSKEVLKERLLTAIQNSEGFGML